MSRLTTKQRRARKRAQVGADNGERLVAVTVDARGVVHVPALGRRHTLRLSYRPGDRRVTAVAEAVVSDDLIRRLGQIRHVGPTPWAPLEG